MSALQCTGGLSNGGELVGLYTPAGDVVDEVSYDDVAPWPTLQADGGGHSIVLCDYNSDNSDGANWTISINYVDTNADGSRIWGSLASSDNVCSLNPGLTWSATTFNEDAADDGSISTVVD